MKRDRFLVLGDLCWDFSIDDADPSSLRHDVREGHEETVRCRPALEAGGSAWLFAKEVVASGHGSPLILASVGTDSWGDRLLACLAESGIPADTVHRVSAAPTDMIGVARWSAGGRLMFVPSGPVSDHLPPGHVSAILDRLDPATVRWAWLSGHGLVNRESPRWRSAAMVADWCHTHRVPIALDLVPHDFWPLMGNLGQVIAHLGGVDLLVGAASTLRGLGYGDPGPPGIEAMRSTGRAAARAWGKVLVQGRTSAEEFGQMLCAPGGAEMLTEIVPLADGQRGLGDRLAVRALECLLEMPVLRDR
jgi:sugar/nucleoside kinase (ribokinase family)